MQSLRALRVLGEPYVHVFLHTEALLMFTWQAKAG